MDQYGACWGGHYNLSSKDFPPTIDHHRSTPKSPTGLTVHLAHINEHQPFLRRGKGKSLDAQYCPLEEETELHQPHMHPIVQSPTKTILTPAADRRTQQTAAQATASIHSSRTRLDPQRV